MSRRTQHRAPKEGTREQQLQKEVQQLRRKVKRLEKQVEQGIPLQDPEIEEEFEDIATTKFKLKCPLCESDKISSFTTKAGKTRWGCKSCKKWRGSSE